MPVFRLMTRAAWRAAQGAAEVPPSSLDRADGFLHLSGREHVLGTADRYFDPAEPLVALEVPEGALGAALRWEWVAARGARFPHLYGPLSVSAVAAVHALDHDGRGFVWGARAAR